jgi:formate-dependent nitrite reductase membrane component NrfD
MAFRELPVVRQKSSGGDGRYVGAAVTHTRDAYRDVPILQRPPWGGLVAGYFFFGGVSSGAFMVGALANLVGGDRRARLARTAHYVAFAALLPCPPLLIADLGKPIFFHHMLRIFKPSSPMNLGAWTLMVHGLGTTAGAMVSLAQDDKIPLVGPLLVHVPESIIAVGGIPSALTLGGYTGVLLGTTSIPVWYTSPLLGALFMAGAIATGAAAITLTGEFTGRTEPGDRRALAPLLLTSGMVELALLGGYIVTSGAAAKPLLQGKQGRQLGGAAVAIAVAAALEAVAMRAKTGKPLFSAIGAAAALAGGAMLRWAIVHAGHASAADRGGTLEAMSPSPAAPGWGPARG